MASAGSPHDDFARLGADIFEPGTPIGRGLTAEAAADMGLPAGVAVGAGLIDAHAGALASLGASRAESRAIRVAGWR